MRLATPSFEFLLSNFGMDVCKFQTAYAGIFPDMPKKIFCANLNLNMAFEIFAACEGICGVNTHLGLFLLVVRI
jgi:hypothetical protein